ncbi:hypothetical protein KV205_35525 [Streptomyces sp. SKN60]|nr:hypothetical protein [Streptomyces sp. SKN60]
MALVDFSGKRVTATAWELGISSESLRGCTARQGRRGRTPASLTSTDGLKWLHKENREQQTIEILKATAYPRRTVSSGEAGEPQVHRRHHARTRHPRVTRPQAPLAGPAGREGEACRTRRRCCRGELLGSTRRGDRHPYSARPGHRLRLLPAETRQRRQCALAEYPSRAQVHGESWPPSLCLPHRHHHPSRSCFLNCDDSG